jgi:multiple sugar transport system substrate-binding protein
MTWTIKKFSVILIMSCLVMILSNVMAYAVEITFWHTGSQDEVEGILAVAQDFTKQTGIQVKAQAFSWNESRTKYLTAIAAGVTPDIGTMGSTWPTFFGIKGGMVDLMKEFPVETKKILSETFPGTLDAVKYKDTVYGLRYDMTTYLLYVRLDIFNQLGLKVPTTWAELTAIMPKLKAAKKDFVIGWGNKEWIGAAPYIWQAGGDLYTPDGLRSNLSSPQAIQGLKFYTDLYTKYAMPSGDSFTGFVTGDYPIMMDGDWIGPTLVAQAPEIAGKWAVAVLPKGPTGNAGFIGGRNMGIFTASKNKKEAMQFLVYLTSAKAQKKIFDTIIQKAGGVMLSPNVKAWDLIGLDKNYARILKTQLDASRSPRFVIGGDESYQYLNNAINEVILTGADLNAAVQKADQKINNQLQATRVELGIK